jgi:uncharacterized membrane protein YphA (DoxX/SURF4 family)
MDRTRLVYGLGAVGDFALQWQPVPKGIAGREVLAYLSAAALLAGGLATIWKRAAAWGALALGALYGVWVVVLHLPNSLSGKPSDIGAWNAVAEALALSMGGLAGWGIAQRPVWAERATRFFGLCPVIFGLAHFGYAKFTASMVPGFFPAPLFWAYLTGACQMAGGLALITGVVPRVAATLLAAMYAVFALTLHLPRVIGAPSERIEWTMLFIALSMTGAAWIVRSAVKAP